MSKLVPHVIGWTSPAMAWANRAGFWKRLNGAAPLVRFYWPDPEQNARIANMAVDQTVADIVSVAQPGCWVEVFNEVAQRQGLGLEQHADFMAAIAPKLHAAGLAVAGFSFSTGNPGVGAFGDADDFQYLFNRGWCGVDAIALHEYWGPKGFDEYNALRHRALVRGVPSHPPILITECGRDAVDGGGRGWQASGLSGDAYVAELLAYDAELAKDAYVLHAAVFTAGPTPDWAAFSTDGLDTGKFVYAATAVTPAPGPTAISNSGDSTVGTPAIPAVAPTVDDQGNTYRCGPFSVRQWFEGYGYQVTGLTSYQQALATADSQQGFSFQQEHDLVAAMAAEIGGGCTVTWLGDGFVRDFPTFEQALMDGWSQIVGVLLSDLHPGLNYYHFEDVYSVGGVLRSADPFSAEDGDNGHPAFATLVQAIKDNWDPVLIGLAFRLSAPIAAAVRPSPMQPLEALLHKIGDASYEQPVPAETIQELVQEALTTGGWKV